jgi:ribosomal protein L2
MNYLKYLLYNINKKLKLGCSLKAGRNFLGKICVHHQFGGKNFKKFNIDFFRRIEQYGYIYKIIIDFNRTAFIGGVIYENGLFSYIILAEKLYVGNKIYSGVLNVNNRIGYTNILKNVNLFSIINNLERNPAKGISLIRAAGSSALLTNLNKKIAVLKLKSGYNIFLPVVNLISIGIVSNIHHKFNKLNKAGKS